MRFCIAKVKAWLRNFCPSRRRLSADQDQFMERLSHEMRTSLTGVVGYSEFIELTSTEPMMNFTAKIIRQSSQGLARISNSFFDLHLLETGQLSVNSTTFSISNLVQDVVRVNQKNALEKNVELSLKCSDDTYLFNMNSDLQKVKQVIDALVFGMVQTVDKDGAIRIDVALNFLKTYMELTIVSVHAQPDSHQLHLYEQFWSDSRYEFRLQEGPGIELALAKKMIKFLRGDIRFENYHYEHSRLILKLPLHYGKKG